MALRQRPRPTEDLTPAQREARIRELRERRRARMRMLAIRSAIGSVVAIVLALALGWWLLSTIGGRDFLLAQVKARLPEGTALSWSKAEGPARGPLVLHDVRFVSRGCPAVDEQPVAYPGCDNPRTTTFAAKRVVVDPALRPLLGKRLRLDALDIVDATLDLPDSDEPFELPRWPDSLPQVAPPLALQADTIRIDRLKVTRNRESLVDLRSVRGGIDAEDGRVHVERLVVDSDHGRFTAHGDYAPGDDYRTDLTAAAVFPAPAGRTPGRLGLVARGDIARMDVAVSGNAPAPLRATLTLRGEDAPTWRLRAKTDALDPGVFTGTPADADAPLVALDLRADGTGGRMRLQGRVARGDLVATIQPSAVRIEDQRLRVQPLVVDTFGGRVTLRGDGDFRDPENASYRFAMNARGLTWAGDPDAAEPALPVTANGDVGIAGTRTGWNIAGAIALARDGQDARLTLKGRGDAERLRFDTLQARMPTGRLDGSGEVAWAPALGWKLDATLAGFDPGYFAPDFKGAVDGTLASTGTTRADDGLDAVVDASRLGGNLRGRRLGGRARVVVHTPAPGSTRTDYEGDIALTVGGSRIDAKGKVAAALDVDARLSPLRLDDLLPTAAGTLRGTLALDGTRDAPDIDADLSGSGLKVGDYRADALTARGRLPWRAGGRGGTLAIDARGVDAGLTFSTLRIEAQGAVERLRLRAEARSEVGALALSGSADKRAGRAGAANWSGTLDAVSFSPTRGASWRLQSPARYAQDGRNWTLSQSCFASSGGGSLCANADWPRRGLTVKGNGLPLTLALPYLPEREDGRPWLLRGEIALDAQVRPVGNAWRGTAQVRSAAGGMKNSERARRDLVAYDTLVLDATFDPRRIEAKLGAGLNGDGRVDARIASGWDAYAPLSGEVSLNTDELTWMELLSPDIVEPTGRLSGRITLAGTRAQPALGGQAQLEGFATELPSLNIALSNGLVRMTAQADGSARIDGAVRSGEGTLNLDGTLNWRRPDAPLVLNVRGRNVLASDTRDVRAVIDPDLVVRYQGGQPLKVTGTVGVPSATLDLERLDDGVSASPDVVVLDPVDTRRAPQTPLDLDLTLALGDDVRLNGFGLTGTLGGSLRVRARPGREMTGAGTLEVGGRYSAYGQKLDITRGRLVWSNTAIADPMLDIRAERQVGDVTAGIDVDGRASNPQATVWTDPASDESDALAYLALGRPLSSASADESRQLNAASAALSAGGSLLASQLGSKIGLDDAGVMDSRALGGSVLGIGKYFSPRLYVGYGVSLLGTGQVLTLKYLLRKGFDVQIESSTVENRASINWRREK